VTENLIAPLPTLPPITERDRQSDTYSSLNVINVYKM
jgi:hypothetical protein